MFCKSLTITFIGLLLLPFSVWAGTSVLEGVVKDPGGRPIKGADVRIEGKNFSKIVKTDATGHYISEGLAADTYRVTVVVNGSVKASIPNAKTQSRRPTQLNFDLTAKTASANRHTHRVWVSTPTGTHIGGSGHWIEVYDDTGLPVNDTGTSTNSSIDAVGAGSLQTLRTHPPKGP